MKILDKTKKPTKAIASFPYKGFLIHMSTLNNYAQVHVTGYPGDKSIQERVLLECNTVEAAIRAINDDKI